MIPKQLLVVQTLQEMEVKMPIETVLIVLIIAFIVAMIIYLTYKNTYTGVMYNPRFNLSLVMITMITTIVMVVIGSNISVSLGMVGALSIIRFRTAIKDPRDTAFIFWCIVSGLACGTQNYTIVIVGSLFICIMLFIFNRITKNDSKYTLILKGSGLEVSKVEEVLKGELKDFVSKGKYISKSSTELVYDIKYRKGRSEDSLSHKLAKAGIDVDVMNVVASNTDTMG